MNSELQDQMLSHLSSALIKEVPDSLRAAAMRLENGVLYFYFYFNGEFSEEEQEDMSCVVTEAMDFPNTTCEEFYLRKDFPEPLPNIGIYAFSRDTAVQRSVSRSELAHWDLEIQLGLSLCQALFGKIPLSLRAAGLKTIEEGSELWFLFNEGATEKDHLLVQQATELVSVDFPELKIRSRIELCPFPQELTGIEGLVFYKKEPPILRSSWKHDFFVYLARHLTIPCWLRAVSFRVENLVQVSSPGSVTILHFFYEGNRSEEELLNLKQRTAQILEGSCWTESWELIFKRLDFPKELPDQGHYVFARDSLVRKTFDRSEKHFNLFLSVFQAMLGKVPSCLREVRADFHGEPQKVWFTLDQNIELDLIDEISKDILADFPKTLIETVCIPTLQQVPTNGGYELFRREEPKASPTSPE